MVPKILKDLSDTFAVFDFFGIWAKSRARNCNLAENGEFPEFRDECDA